MSEPALEHLRAELAPIKERLGQIETQINTVRIRADSLPLAAGAADTLQRDVRLVRAAINDIGRTSITAGEVEAMHTGIDRALAEQRELATRITTLERLFHERSP